MTNFSAQVMARIRRENLKPQPKWLFQAKKIANWLGLLTLLAVAAMSVGLIVDIIQEMNLFELVYHSNGLRIMLASVPYFWIGLVAVSLLFATLDLMKTLNGYRYRLRYSLGLFAGVVFSLGFASYTLGFSDKAENFIEKNVPGYQMVTVTPQEFWSQPEEGVVAGEIVRDSACNCFKLKDDKDVTWEIDDLDAEYAETIKEADNQIIQIPDETQNAAHDSEDSPVVKIIGEKGEGNRIHVKKVIPGKVVGRVKGAQDKQQSDDQTNDEEVNQGRRSNNATKKNESKQNNQQFIDSQKQENPSQPQSNGANKKKEKGLEDMKQNRTNRGASDKKQ